MEKGFNRREWLKLAGTALISLSAGKVLPEEKMIPAGKGIPLLDSAYIYFCPELVEIIAPGPIIRPDGTSICSWSRRPYLELNFEDARFYPIPYFQRYRMKKWEMYHMSTPDIYLSFLIAWIGYGSFFSAYLYDRKTRQGYEDIHLRLPRPELEMMRDSTQGITRYESAKANASFEVRGERRKILVDFPGFAQVGLKAELELFLPESYESICATHLTHPRRCHYDHKINCMIAQGALKLADQTFKLNPADSFAMLDFSRGFPPSKLFWYWAVASGRDEAGKPIGFNLGYGNHPAQTNENAVFYDGKVHKIGITRCLAPRDDLMKPWQVLTEDGRVDLAFIPENVRTSNLKIGSMYSVGNPALGLYSGSLVLDSGRRVQIKNLFGLYEWFNQKW